MNREESLSLNYYKETDMGKTYLCGSEAVRGNDGAFKELTTVAEKFFDMPETPKRFPKRVLNYRH